MNPVVIVTLFSETALSVHSLHISLIACNFLTGMEEVNCIVSTTIPGQVTLVLGGSNFLMLVDRPNSDGGFVIW